MKFHSTTVEQAAQARIELAVNRVYELATHLATYVKPRQSFDKAMLCLELFVNLPKGADYRCDMDIVMFCLDKGALNKDIFELGLYATGFIKS